MFAEYFIKIVVYQYTKLGNYFINEYKEIFKIW